jgi:SAM-dependent methyltransferase
MEFQQIIKHLTHLKFTFGKKKASQAQKSDNWKGICSICGYEGLFNRGHRSIREGYACPGCKASLRYRHQAEMLLDTYGSGQIKNFAELAQNQSFRDLCIYEPGIIGPFRKYLKHLPHYYQSYYWPDLKPGELRKAIACQNLEQLTFEDEFFDLIITSDIFEHIRKPFIAFKEIYRVLKKGGCHVFTIPMAWPLPPKTEFRIDTSTPEDIALKEPVYHGSPVDDNGSLVYTDFGMDMIEELNKIGFETSYKGFQYNLTFRAIKPKTV